MNRKRIFFILICGLALGLSLYFFHDESLAVIDNSAPYAHAESYASADSGDAPLFHAFNFILCAIPVLRYLYICFLVILITGYAHEQVSSILYETLISLKVRLDH